MLSKNLGKYEIVEWLGGGRFGDVFLARDTIIDKVFALKISRMRREEIAMLKDEARLLAALDHPNIVRFYNIDFIENKFVLVMEYIAGQNLRDRITEGGIDVRETVSLLTPIVDGLAYAHGRGVLHRDLKPENILIAGEKDARAVKITDFGLARFIRAGSLSASSAGTPIYMAPEAWSGSFSARSDIWSVGVMLYEMLTGAPPFLDDSMDGLRKKIARPSFTAPSVLRKDVPDPLEKIVLAALQTDPSSRPDARAVLELIARLEAGVPAGRVQIRRKKPAALQLTPAQRDILESLAGPVLVHGQAGCGKTTTLTQAVNALLDRGVPISSILICTFTNKAASDIRERLRGAVRAAPHDLWLGTLHTLGFRILRRDGERLDINPDFVIRDPATVAAAAGIEVGRYRINAMLRFIEMLKARGIPAAKFEPKNDWESACADVYRRYDAYMREHGILDYDDLILLSVRLLEEHGDIREHYQDLFDYIFVDELQDINPAQYRLLGLIYREHIFFTGDNDQAIYGWRGAQRELMYRVPADYPAVKMFNLNRSFRLAPSIADIANRLMHRAATIIPVGEHSDVFVYAARSEHDEADYIVKEIGRLKKEGFRYRDMAILCRMNQLARSYQDALVRARVPHTLISGAPLYERSDIKPLLDYLEALRDFRPDQTPNSEFNRRADGLLRISGRDAARAHEIYSYHLANRTRLEPGKLIADIIDLTGITGAGIDELQAAPSLADFLNQVRLAQELDMAEWNRDLVRVMTVHSAKGLEFPVVFVVDLAEDIFPMTRKMSSDREIEEERRLCYVALTRAQQKLYLLYPKWRHGRHWQPSRFLVDMFQTAA